jgi:hypothetical protein
MPRKAKSISKSIFEVVGGTYAPAPVNFSSYAQAAQAHSHAPSQHTHQPTSQVSPHYNAHAHNPTAAGFITPPAIPLDPITSFITLVNSNPYVIGLLYLFLNLSGRFLSMELTKQQEQFLSQPFLRPFILGAVMFVATRNIAIAFWSTIIILSIIWIFANENHVLCLIPGWRNNDNKDTDKSYQDNMKAIQGKDHHEEPPHVEHHEPTTNDQHANEQEHHGAADIPETKV